MFKAYVVVIGIFIGTWVGQAAEHFVSPSGNHVPPFLSWADGATNIQAAIDSASVGDVVWVTNGIYNVGGKVMAGDLTNRVAIDKALAVRSVNGPAVTVIEGAWDPVRTNGALAIRCVWMTNAAELNGFTLRNGSTRNAGTDFDLARGGAIWCRNENAYITNCVLTNCFATYGGGAHLGTLDHCTLIGNAGALGGGAWGSTLISSMVLSNAVSNTGGGNWGGKLFNCVIRGNRARGTSGGADGCKLINCTVAENSADTGGGVSTGCVLTNCNVVGNTAFFSGGGCLGINVLDNCIVWGNSAGVTVSSSNYSGSVVFANSCTAPLPVGGGNISLDPQLMDLAHIAPTSPARGAGASHATGIDIDGNSWSNPPAMGCDEVVGSAFAGSLTVSIELGQTPALLDHPLKVVGRFTGVPSRLDWDFGDGISQTNASFTTFHTWTNLGIFTVALTAFNDDNPAGVTTSIQVQIVPLVVPLIAGQSLSRTNFLVRFDGQAGASYTLDYATNLMPPVAWMTVRTIMSSGGTMLMNDTAATNAARFYRVGVR